MQEYPAPITALTRYASENASASSVISVNEGTTSVEIAAVGAPAVVKWIATTDTTASVISAAGTANFDHVIPTATVRRFVIPRETLGTPVSASVVGANQANGLYRRIAYKSIGTASVLLTEY